MSRSVRSTVGNGSRGARAGSAAIAVAVLGVVAAVSGCTAYQARPISAESGMAAFESRSLDDAGLRRYLRDHVDGGRASGAPEPVWDLHHLALAACYFNPELETSRRDWGVAQAARTTAGQRPDASLDVGPAYDVTNDDPSPWVVTAAAAVSVETAGKRGYRQAQAVALAEAARLDTASRAWEIRQRVQRSLIDIQSAQRRRATLDEQASLQAQNVRILEGELAAGAVSTFDVTEARIELQRTRLAHHDAVAAATAARVRLAEAVGIPGAALSRVALSFDGLEVSEAPPDPAQARRRAALRRPDVLAALAEYAASEAGLRLEVARQYPNVRLQPGYEFDQGDDKWGIGFSLDLPMLDGNAGPIKEAEARRAAAEARFNAVQARVLGEVDAAVAAYRAARDKLADAETMRAELGDQEQAGEAMLAAGAVSRAEMIGLRLQANEAELLWQEAVRDVQLARAGLDGALQPPSGLPPDVWQARRNLARPDPRPAAP